MPTEPAAGHAFSLIWGNKRLAGSADRRHRRRPRRCSTSAASTRSSSDIELIPIQKINEAYERMIKADVRYRFVIDNASLKQG